MRLYLLSISIILGIGSAVECTDPAPSTTVIGLADRLRALTADKTRSYHSLLHEASHEIRRVALDRPWSEVEPELRRQGLRQILAYEEGPPLGLYQYVVTREGWQAGNHSAHTLYLDFKVDRRNVTTVASAKPGLVKVAAAGLFVEPNRPYEQMLAKGIYPEGSMVFRGLRMPEAADTAKKYPIVKKIELTYDFKRDRWAPTVEQGFDLRLTFGDSPSHDQRGKSEKFFSVSGLDAPQDFHGKPLVESFKPTDTIGKLRSYGGTEWKRGP